MTIPVSVYTIEEGRNYVKKKTKGDDKYYFRTIPSGNYDTISLNQAIVDVMNTAYAKVNNAYLEKLLHNQILFIILLSYETMTTNFKYLPKNNQRMQKQQRQLFDTYPTIKPNLPLFLKFC